MNADHVFAVIGKIGKDTMAAADTQRLYMMRQEAPPVQYSSKADSFLLIKELSGEEELLRDRGVTEAASTKDSNPNPSSKIGGQVGAKLEEALQTRPSAQPLSFTPTANPPFLGALLRRGTYPYLTAAIPASNPRGNLSRLPTVSAPSKRIPPCNPAKPGPLHVPSPPSPTAALSPSPSNPPSATPTPGYTRTPSLTQTSPSAPTSPASAPHTTPRDRILRARALRNLQIDLETAELKIRRTEQLLKAKKLKRKIWDIEDEFEDEGGDGEDRGRKVKRRRVR